MGTESRAFLAGPLTVEQPTADGLFTELSGRVVPYNTPADIGSDYTETMAPGVFAESLRGVKIPLYVNHADARDPAAEPVGVSTSYTEKPDGLYMRFQLDSTPDAQRQAGRVHRGMLPYLSVRFQPDPAGTHVTMPAGNGLPQVRRTRARLVSVSLENTPAYVGAVVTGIRTVDPLRDVAAADAVFDLAVKLGQPLIVDAITGTPQEQTAAAGLVRTAVERFGATAATTELAQIAAGLSRVPGRAQLAVNVERARQLIDPDAMTPRARSAHLDYWRRVCGSPAAGDVPPTQPRRHRRRR